MTKEKLKPLNRKINISIAYEKFELFLKLSKKKARTQPFIVTVMMHEYFRCLYPDDSFIKERYAEDNLENIILCLDTCINTLEAITNLGSYFLDNQSLEKYLGTFEHESKFKTQKLYGKLWKERKTQKALDSSNILKESFQRNGFDVNYFKGKRILDMGCGSGRFTLALAKLGASYVIGVDLGNKGLEIGRKMAALNGIKNVNFEKHSVLDLPYDNESFDFVFCKGVFLKTIVSNSILLPLSQRLIWLKPRLFNCFSNSFGLICSSMGTYQLSIKIVLLAGIPIKFSTAIA